MIDFIKRIFCKHKFEIVKNLTGLYSCNNEEPLDVSVNLLECKNCSKRFHAGDLWGFRSTRRKNIKLWENHQLDIDTVY